MVKWIWFALDRWWAQGPKCQRSIAFSQSKEQNLFEPLATSDGKKPVWKGFLGIAAEYEEKARDDKSKTLEKKSELRSIFLKCFNKIFFLYYILLNF